MTEYPESMLTRPAAASYRISATASATRWIALLNQHRLAGATLGISSALAAPVSSVGSSRNAAESGEATPYRGCSFPPRILCAVAVKP